MYIGEKPTNNSGMYNLHKYNRYVSSNKFTGGTEFTLNGTAYDVASGDVHITGQGYYTFVCTQTTGFKLLLWGAAGGSGTSSTYTYGSAGGYAYGEFLIPAGTYTLLVGQGGKATAYSGYVSFPDGGPGTQSDGGGSTRFGPNVANAAGNYNAASAVFYLIAGGGGGGANYAGYNSTGTERGEGGGTNGGFGGWYYAGGESATSPGGGGTQSAGGAGGTAGRLANGTAGAKYYGGAATGGGGGGGYYGGGGAAGYYSQGGGGSGYADAAFVSNAVLQGGGVAAGNTYYTTYDGYDATARGFVSPAGNGTNAGSGSDGAAIFQQI